MKRLIQDLDSLGYRRVLIRTDGEPAILDLFAKIKEQWWGEVIKVEAATGDHDANGEAEQAVQKIEDETRTFKDALEDSIGDKIPATHDIPTLPPSGPLHGSLTVLAYSRSSINTSDVLHNPRKNIMGCRNSVSNRVF